MKEPIKSAIDLRSVNWAAMKAGTELDWLIARVLGWEIVPRLDGFTCLRPDYPASGWMGATPEAVVNHMIQLDLLPEYSTDLNEAFTLPGLFRWSGLEIDYFYCSQDNDRCYESVRTQMPAGQHSMWIEDVEIEIPTKEITPRDRTRLLALAICRVWLSMMMTEYNGDTPAK